MLKGYDDTVQHAMRFQYTARSRLIQGKFRLSRVPVEPFAHLRNTLNRLPDHPINKIAELLPQNWRTLNS